MTMPTAHLDVERSLVSVGQLVAGVDEVGRGALAGPVCVGVVVVDPHSSTEIPSGLTDSKLLSVPRREALLPQIHTWAISSAVGFASAAEIDAIGIIGALRRAAERALALVVAPHMVLLDGSHNWLVRKDEPAMLLAPEPVRPDPFPEHNAQISAAPPSVTRIKADISCAAVSAASVIAKLARDRYMLDASLVHTDYNWQSNKGYAADIHREAIRRCGTTVEHRWSWNLLGDEVPITQ